jgi:hypothetical protein
MLLHAKARWPSAVHLCLWPYALRMAVYVYNTAPVLLDGTSRLERFSGVNCGFRMKDNHAFGCPQCLLFKMIWPLVTRSPSGLQGLDWD